MGKGISEAAQSFVEKIYWKLMTFLDCVVMGALVYLLYMWQQIFNSIFLSSKSHNGGKARGRGCLISTFLINK